jgi:hypothetical protein
VRLLVCGGRDYVDQQAMFDFLDELAGVLRVDVLIEGEQRGDDTLARDWAESRGIPIDPYPAEWDRYRSSAGMIRNQRMLREGQPELVVAFPTPKSVGTWGMVRIARMAGVTTWVMPEDRHKITALGEGVFV